MQCGVSRGYGGEGDCEIDGTRNIVEEEFGGYEMKKLLVLVVILAVAAPSMAATTVSCAQVGTTKAFTVSYTYDGVGIPPRAFALDVTLSAGTISGVTAAKVGESTSASLGFGIFPGTIDITTAGVVSTYGSPVAPAADPGAKPGIGTNAVTLELGSLYATGGAPNVAGTPKTAVLATVAVSTTPATVTIVGNGTRGSLVLEDATSTTASTSCALVSGICKGDVNISNSVTTADVVALVGNLNTFGGAKKTISSTSIYYSLPGDADVSGSNTTADVVKIVGWLNTFGGAKKTIVCPHTYN